MPSPVTRSASTTRRAVRVGLAVLVMVGGPARMTAQTGAPVSPASSSASSTWFRVFLTSGEVIATPTEFTRVDDIVLLHVPVDVAAAPETRSVTLAASQVDWAKTDAYRESVRRARFEAAGGARAFAAFSEEVATTLRQVAEEPDAIERIRRLESARARLAQWPALHHGYRAAEVNDTLSVIDDLLNGLRAAAGQQTFSLALTASARPPVAEATAVVLGAPTVQEQVTQSLALAPRVSDPVERLHLLESASSLLDRHASALDATWARDARTRARRQISREHRVTRAYARLRTWMLEKTNRLLALADVRGLMRLREDVQKRDARLDHARPDEMQALLGTVDARLEAARRQRLQLERWEERRPVLERYAGVVGRHVAASDALLRALEDVKALSGPGPALLTQAEGRLAGARADAGLLAVPDEARQLHQTWLSAQQLATRALQARRAAMRSGDMPQAWEASAAAAGALLLLQQLRTDLAGLVRPPVRLGQGF